MPFAAHLAVKQKEALGVTLLTLLVVLSTTTVHLVQLTDVILGDSIDRVNLVKKQIFDRAKLSLMRAENGSPRGQLGNDRDLQSFLQAIVGYSPHLVYAGIIDSDGTTILHSQKEEDGAMRGEKRGEKPTLEELVSLGHFRRFYTLYKGGTVYESRLPMVLDERPFGTVTLGLHTSLLREQLKESLTEGLSFAAIILPVAWIITMVLATWTLKPIRILAQQMEQMRKGEFEAVTDLSRTDEFRELASELQLLGAQMQSDRLRLVHDKLHLKSIVDHLEDGVLFLNHERRVTFCNKAMERVLERPLEESVGQPLEVACASNPALARVIEVVFLRKKTIQGLTMPFPMVEGPKEYQVSAFCVLEHDDVVGVVVVVRDLESVKTVQSLISYSAKLTALGRLKSGIAHEIKNPLNSMIIHLELLKEQVGSSPDEATQSIEVITSEIRRLDRVVQAFLKFARPQELTLTSVDVNQLLKEEVALVEAQWVQHDIRVRTHFDAQLPAITADAELLSQAFLNLLLNACQAMPGGGTVTIATAGKGFESVSVSITDEGVGIPRENRDKIFNLYYTTKPEGSGVGLSMVFRILQLHDGTIEVDSDEGRGTTVTVRLPLRHVA